MLQIAGENASVSAELSPWWDAGRHADRRPFLLARDRIRRAIRGWFETRGFLEVETATLQVSPGAGAHLHGVRAPLLGSDGRATDAWLRTSPEFACKSLLAAGERRIFEFGRVWRDRERGPLHHPEFTLLEWYRAGEPYETLMDDCAALLALAAEAAGAGEMTWRGRRCDPRLVPERLSVAEAFARHAGIDLMVSIGDDGVGDRAGLARAAADAGVRVAADDHWSDVFSKVMVERIEPRVGHGRATILHGYPTPEAALARSLAGRSAARRAIRTVRLRSRAGQRLRRTHRPGGAAAAAGGGAGRDGARPRLSTTDRRGIPRGLAVHAAGVRLRPRVRPSRHAGERRHPHRSGALVARAGVSDGAMVAA